MSNIFLVYFHLLNNETEIKILKLENTSIVFTLIMYINSWIKQQK